MENFSSTVLPGGWQLQIPEHPAAEGAPGAQDLGTDPYSDLSN